MKKLYMIVVLLFSAAAFADECYFQSRATSYYLRPALKRISCATYLSAMQGSSNYAALIGEEGNLIFETDNERFLIGKFFYSLEMQDYVLYGYIEFSGGVPNRCETTKSSGVCSAFDYTTFAIAFKNFLHSPERIKIRR